MWINIETGLVAISLTLILVRIFCSEGALGPTPLALWFLFAAVATLLGVVMMAPEMIEDRTNPLGSGEPTIELFLGFIINVIGNAALVVGIVIALIRFLVARVRTLL